MEKNEIRAYILIRNKLGIDAKTIHYELVTALGDEAPCIRTVYNWCERFNAGQCSTEDNFRSGRPITATNQQNISQIENLVNENPHISLNQIEEETQLCRGTIETIIHQHLNLRKLASRWIPYALRDDQKRKRVELCRSNLAMIEEGKWRLCDIVTGDETWIYHRKIEKKATNSSWVKPGESPRTVVRRSQFEAKTMFCIFFKSTGALVIDSVDKGKTVDHKYYLKNCIQPLVSAINEQRVKSGTQNIKLLHDNARPHVAKNVIKYLEQEGIKIIDHPPYSPDLAPCDFWLFDLFKKNLVDHTDSESLKSQITEILESIPKQEYLLAFQKWVERMRLCINNNGDYFEHLIK